MKSNITRYLTYISPLLSAVLVACGNGSTSGSNSDSGANTGSLNNLSMVAPSSYPAGIASMVPVVVTNNGATTINNLNYAIDSASNTTGAQITVESASAASCRIIAAHASCTLNANIAATPVSHPGSFGISTSQGALTTTNKIKTLATLLSVNVNIGLVQLAANSSSGADGLNLYYPSSVVGNQNGPTQIIVTAVVTSANAGAFGAFNTIQLVDANGNILDYSVLTGNSGTGMTDLAVGSIVSFLVTIPSGSNQVQFSARTAQNGTAISTATNSNTTIATNPAIATGIMSVLPNYFDLTTTNESQAITLINSGNGPISSLSFIPSSPLTMLSNTCGASLESGAIVNT